MEHLSKSDKERVQSKLYELADLLGELVIDYEKPLLIHLQQEGKDFLFDCKIQAVIGDSRIKNIKDATKP